MDGMGVQSLCGAVIRPSHIVHVPWHAFPHQLVFHHSSAVRIVFDTLHPLGEASVALLVDH
jgi:hypothetical protein